MIIQKARKHASLDFQYADNAHKRNIKGPFLEEGQWYFTLIPCPKHKFAERWAGPFQIIKKISDHVYVVQMDEKEKVMNVGKLKRYQRSKYTPEQLRPQDDEFTPSAAAKTVALPQNTPKRLRLEYHLRLTCIRVIPENLSITPRVHNPATRLTTPGLTMTTVWRYLVLLKRILHLEYQQGTKL